MCNTYSKGSQKIENISSCRQAFTVQKDSFLRSDVLKQLKTDKEHIIITADKGVTPVVMDRHEHIKKAKILLEDTNTHRPIPTDPTNKHKTKLINILKNIKAESRISENTYKMNPTGASPPKFYSLPKIHKKDIPLRLIVSSIGSVTYEVVKELASFLKPLVGTTI